MFYKVCQSLLGELFTATSKWKKNRKERNAYTISFWPNPALRLYYAACVMYVMFMQERQWDATQLKPFAAMCYQAQMKTNMNPRHNNFHTSADCTVLCTVLLLYKLIQNYLKLCLLSAYEWSSRVHGSSCYTMFLVCMLLTMAQSCVRNSAAEDVVCTAVSHPTPSAQMLGSHGYWNCNINTN